MRRTVLLLVLAAGVLGVAAPAHGITFPGENGRIAYDCSENVSRSTPMAPAP